MKELGEHYAARIPVVFFDFQSHIVFTLPKFRRVRIPNIPKFWIIATFSNYKCDFIRFIGNAGIGKNPLNKQHYLVISGRQIIWLTLTQWPSAWGIKRVETRFHPWIQNTGDSFYFARIVCPSVSIIDLNWHCHGFLPSRFPPFLYLNFDDHSLNFDRF